MGELDSTEEQLLRHSLLPNRLEVTGADIAGANGFYRKDPDPTWRKGPEGYKAYPWYKHVDGTFVIVYLRPPFKKWRIRKVTGGEAMHADYIVRSEAMTPPVKGWQSDRTGVIEDEMRV